MTQTESTRETNPGRPFQITLWGYRHHFHRPGHTLVELTVVMIVIGVLASFGVPKFLHSLEQSRVDMAATNLRAIWTAQRLYWLKHQTYAPDLNSLYADPADGENLLAVPGSGQPSSPSYECSVTSDSVSATSFQVTAIRSPPSSWSGYLVIDQTGVVSDPSPVTGPDGHVYHPTPSFQ